MTTTCEAPRETETVRLTRAGNTAAGERRLGLEADGTPAAPPGLPVTLQPAARFAVEPLKWLWKDHFALGKLAVVAGAPEVGKSLLVAAELAAHVSTGSPWPDGSPCPLGEVVIVSGHDDVRDILVPWLSAHGADLARVHLADGVTERRSEPGVQRLTSLYRLPAFDAALGNLPGVKLVIFDPVCDFQACTGATLTGLRELAERHGAAFILLAGTRERRGRTRLESINNPDLVAAARSVWLVERDPDNPRRRTFMPIRNKFSGDVEGYAWQLSEGRVQWEADRVKPPPAPIDSARAREKRDAMAAAFIADLLQDGPRRWEVIETKGKSAGHGARSLDRVRGVVAETFKQTGDQGRWLWRLIGDKRRKSEADVQDDFPALGLPHWPASDGQEQEEEESAATAAAPAASAPSQGPAATPADSDAGSLDDDDEEDEELEDEDEEDDELDEDEEDEGEEDAEDEEDQDAQEEARKQEFLTQGVDPELAELLAKFDTGDFVRQAAEMNVQKNARQKKS